MKHIAALALAACLALPVQADDSKTQDGLDLVEEGMKLFFRGLMEEIEPQLEDLQKEIGPALREFQDELGPAMDELMALLGEIDAYHPPERLPNGDIILRRKSPIELDRAPERTPEGQIDL